MREINFFFARPKFISKAYLIKSIGALFVCELILNVKSLSMASLPLWQF